MRIRPCIDLHQGKVKQIVGASLNDSGARENFVSDKNAEYYASLYRKDQLPGGHIIMLGPGNEEAALSALKAFPQGMQIGGGINLDNAAYWLDQGASHVIVTSYIFREGEILWENLQALVEKIGKDRLVLDLSCKRVGDGYRIVTDRWQKISRQDLDAEILQKLSAYCDEFLVHAADVEGKREGIEEGVLSILADLSPIPAVYAGGIRDLKDIELVKTLGRGKVDATVGSALDIFGGSFSYKELTLWQERQKS